MRCLGETLQLLAVRIDDYWNAAAIARSMHIINRDQSVADAAVTTSDAFHGAPEFRMISGGTRAFRKRDFRRPPRLPNYPGSIGFINPVSSGGKKLFASDPRPIARTRTDVELREDVESHSRSRRNEKRYADRCENGIKRNERRKEGEEGEGLHNTVPRSGFERTQWYGRD
ncbi:hypothetical protein HN011_005611 [Eciton burchellii]|jgi:hypothetical protein|nr:hypothetical protein HN011_005611 [Eciton burchellii]